MCVRFTDIPQGYQTLRHLDGGLRVPVIKIIVVRQVRKLPACTAFEREDNHALKPARLAKIVRTFVLGLLLHVWSAKPEDPQIEPHG